MIGVTVPSTDAFARNTKLMMSIEDLMNDADSRRLYGDIDLYFGEQDHPEIERKVGEYVANKKTNAFNKSDTEACKWVMLSALKDLQQRAKEEGGNAVVNIRSYYDRREVSSETQYECRAGNVVARVVLIGDVVKLEEESDEPEKAEQSDDNEEKKEAADDDEKKENVEKDDE